MDVRELVVDLEQLGMGADTKKVRLQVRTPRGTYYIDDFRVVETSEHVSLVGGARQ